jgi:acyl dehydratase
VAAGQYPNWTIDRAPPATNDLGAMSDTSSFRREHGPVTSELLVRLATLLNDFNPAHYDLDFATEIGMPGVIGPGTLLQGWILSDIESELETPSAAGSVPERKAGSVPERKAGSVPHGVREIDLRFRAPFLLGDTVTIEYEVNGGALRADVRASNGTGEPRVVAVATVVLAASADTGE